MKYLKLFLPIITIVFNFAVASASPSTTLPDGTSYCFTGSDDMAEYSSLQEFEKLAVQGYYLRPGTLFLQNTSWTCIEKEGWLDAMEVIEITSESLAVATFACSGGSGAAFAIGFGIAGITTKMAKVFVKNIPCQDQQAERDVEYNIKKTLCKIANANQANCDISKLQIKYKDEYPYTPQTRL